MSTAKHPGTALITGASSGIGAVYADRLARDGYDLILVARNGRKLRELARTISTRHGSSVEPVAADLTRAADLAGVAAILRTDASITMLVNNAGIGASGPLLQASDGQLDQL